MEPRYYPAWQKCKKCGKNPIHYSIAQLCKLCLLTKLLVQSYPRHGRYTDTQFLDPPYTHVPPKGMLELIGALND